MSHPVRHLGRHPVGHLGMSSRPIGHVGWRHGASLLAGMRSPFISNKKRMLFFCASASCGLEMRYSIYPYCPRVLFLSGGRPRYGQKSLSREAHYFYPGVDFVMAKNHSAVKSMSDVCRPIVFEPLLFSGMRYSIRPFFFFFFYLKMAGTLALQQFRITFIKFVM